jgi:hypothetical protein
MAAPMVGENRKGIRLASCPRCNQVDGVLNFAFPWRGTQPLPAALQRPIIE